jgi:energy-coupling factor transport system ATP-binding protein
MTAVSPQILLQLQDVTVHVGPPGSQAVRALEAVTLTVRAGESVGLMGASGSGKSTLLHVLCRLIKPTRGVIDIPATATMPSLVFQFPENQLFSETVAADVGYGLRESGVAAEAVRERVEQALVAVGLEPQAFGHRVPFHLSGGEQRRVALAGALAQHRQLLLLDEPTLALDVQGVRHLQQVLQKHQDTGAGTWIASHDADFLAATCSQLVVLDKGRVAYCGEAARFWADADQAAALGVRLPRTTRLRQRLMALADLDLSPHPQENELVAALRQLQSGER